MISNTNSRDYTNRRSTSPTAAATSPTAAALRMCNPGSRLLLLCVPLAAFLASCASTKFASPRAQLDLSPVDCGYRWFQTGYSPDIQVSCESDRAELRDAQIARAVQNAWDVAGQRCPDACPPRELPDTVVWENPSPDGVCRNDTVYFHTRLFFICSDSK